MVLVTGASGLVGSALIQRLLQNGETVRAVVHENEIHTTSDNLQMVKGDVLDVIFLENAFTQVDEVYHTAARVSFDPVDAAAMMKINVDGTANVVNAALNAGIRKMVHVSSVAALGRLQSGIRVNETAEWDEEKNNSVYGKTKYLGELEVWRGIAEGLNAVIINPSIILGPGNWTDGSTKIFKQVRDGLAWYTNGTNGVVDVRDVVDIMIRLMRSDIAAEKFIVSGHTVSYKTLLEKIATAFGKKPPAKNATAFLSNMVWRFEKIKSLLTHEKPLITKESAETANQVIDYDNSKLKNAFPDFSFTSLNDTIDYTVKTLKQKFNNG